MQLTHIKRFESDFSMTPKARQYIRDECSWSWLAQGYSFPKDKQLVDEGEAGDVVRIAVCVGVSNDLTFAAVSTLLNFRDLHGDAPFSFILYSDKFSRRTRKAIERLNLDVSLEVFAPKVRGIMLHGSKAIGQFSPLVLSKLEAFRLAKNYDSVIWLDYDILILRRLDELFSDFSFDFAHMSTGTDTACSFVRPPLGHRVGTEGVLASLLVLNSSLKESDEIYERCWELFRREFDNLILPEQGLIELALPGFNVRRKILPGLKYSARPDSDTSNASIIHCWGGAKFWSGLAEPRWEAYYQEWLHAGGRPYSEAHHRAVKTLRKFKWLISNALYAFKGLLPTRFYSD